MTTNVLWDIMKCKSLTDPQKAMLTQRDIDRLEGDWYKHSDSTNARMHRLLYGSRRPGCPARADMGNRLLLIFVKALRARPQRVQSRWLKRPPKY
jgi:hypothetical protein